MPFVRHVEFFEFHAFMQDLFWTLGSPCDECGKGPVVLDDDTVSERMSGDEYEVECVCLHCGDFTNHGVSIKTKRVKTARMYHKVNEVF